MDRQIKRRAADVYYAVADERYRAFNAQRKILDLADRTAAARRTAARLPRSPLASVGREEEALAKLDTAGRLPLPGLVRPEWIGPRRPVISASELGLNVDPYIDRIFVGA